MSTTAEGLQESLDKLGDYCQKWGLDGNAQKSNIVDIGSKKKNRNKIMFKFNNTKLKCVDNYTYLGFNINSNGKSD